ncbi:MAG: glycosyltransferase family 2 protein [Chitinophagaceae bacterium]|nr:glycosyltransferase family 2 protein [Chitinophagaceae bacterium]MBL0130372.1 glycosyltransferase family 2 protein [Chitinophagaceae bacterium]MBL0272477.1 glycosyltransferase family 2 protein [Chitinophagaceae bacterium]
MELSIVIICKNDVTGIERTLQSVRGLGAEILVYDSGSIDGTKEVALKNGASLYEGEWEGYGRNRFKAAQLAKYDWILMLDTDEVVDEALKESIKLLDFTSQHQVYRLQYKNYFGTKWLRYGEWGKDSHIRLGNRRGIKTDGEIVHEKLFVQPGIEICLIKGHILHYTVKNSIDFAQKMINYAQLSAEKYNRQGKKAGFLKIFVSPAFAFIKNYFFKLGFLDGWEGYICARMGAWYTFMKYARLRELNKSIKTQL